MRIAQRIMLLSVAMSLFIFLPGCQKLFDYIKDHPGEPKKYCKVKKLKRWAYGVYSEINIAYNAAGNPVSVLVDDLGATGGGADMDYRFRYDQQNRLSDYIMNLHGSPGAMSWNRYSYPTQSTVRDTVFYLSGLVTDVIPPNAATAYSYVVYTHYLDNKGRIVQTTQHAPSGDFFTYYSYDEQGNRVVQDVTYDNKVNPYRTNPVWSFVYWDYSLNNPLRVNDQITAYNEWGLPVKLIVDEGQLFGNYCDTVKIEYQCNR